MNKKHEEYWQSIHGHRQAIEGFLKRPSALFKKMGIKKGELSKENSYKQ